MTDPTRGDSVLTVDVLRTAIAQLEAMPRPPEVYLVHPDDKAHLVEHAVEKGDLNQKCWRCGRIVMRAERVGWSFA